MKYYRGTQNVTAQVVGAGYDFTISPSKAKRFRIKLKATTPSSAPPASASGSRPPAARTVSRSS